jgi:V/A-type H+-transporting ATPase subunit E
MQSKLQELTDKLLQEGVEKGNAEAQQIVEKAHAEAENIVEKAKKEAQTIIEEAKKKGAETKLNTETEIKLSGRQAINALKQQVVDMVNAEITREAISKSFDKDFIKKLIEITLTNWLKSGQSMDLNILVPTDDEQSLSDYFKKETKQLLDKGVTIKSDSSVKNGFQLSPKDGSYKVSFTDEDFINFFKQYLRPRLVEILFSAE